LNTWKVYWWAEGKKKFRRFPGPKPTEAIAYAKELKKAGTEVAIVSSSKAFRVPEAKKYSREPGMLWCPYCIDWRWFKIMAIRREHYTSAEALRCPVCHISTDDYYVRKFNEEVRSTSEILAQEAGRVHRLKKKDRV
jgi:hypothetical protein